MPDADAESKPAAVAAAAKDVIESAAAAAKDVIEEDVSGCVSACAQPQKRLRATGTKPSAPIAPTAPALPDPVSVTAPAALQMQNPPERTGVAALVPSDSAADGSEIHFASYGPMPDFETARLVFAKHGIQLARSALLALRLPLLYSFSCRSLNPNGCIVQLGRNTRRRTAPSHPIVTHDHLRSYRMSHVCGATPTVFVSFRTELFTRLSHVCGATPAVVVSFRTELFTFRPGYRMFVARRRPGWFRFVPIGLCSDARISRR
jgi:hypothetical protein